MKTGYLLLLLFLASCTANRKVIAPGKGQPIQRIGMQDKKEAKKYQYSVYDRRTGKYRAVYLDKIGKYGIVDSTGSLVIPARYDAIYSTDNGIFRCMLHGKWGYIDVNEKEIIPIGKFESILEFNEGLAAAFQSNRWGFVNGKGEVIVPFRFFGVTDFYEGRAFVQDKEGGKYAVIDRRGKFYSDYEFICNNMCFFRNNACYVYHWNGAMDIIDTMGMPRFGYRYKSLSFSSPGDEYVWVQDPAGGSQGKWGLLNSKAEVVLPFDFDYAWGFIYGRAKVKKKGKWGLVKPTGEYIAECIYDTQDDAHLGQAPYAQVGEAIHDGSAYSNGERGKDFSQSAFIYKDFGSTRAYGILDMQNRLVVPFVYGFTTCFQNGYAIVMKGGKFGFVDSTGAPAIEPQYRHAEPFTEGRSVVVQGEEYLLIDRAGKVMFNCPSIARIAPERYVVQVNGLAGLIDGNGVFIIPAEYYSIAFPGSIPYQLVVERNHIKIGANKYSVETTTFDLKGKRLGNWKRMEYQALPEEGGN